MSNQATTTVVKPVSHVIVRESALPRTAMVIPPPPPPKPPKDR